MNNGLKEDFKVLPQDSLLRLVANTAKILYEDEEQHYTDHQEKLKELFGGTIWNSGGNCMCLTIELGKQPDGLYNALTVSSDVACITHGDTVGDAFSPPDERGFSDDKTINLY